MVAQLAVAKVAQLVEAVVVAQLVVVKAAQLVAAVVVAQLAVVKVAQLAAAKVAQLGRGVVGLPRRDVAILELVDFVGYQYFSEQNLVVVE